MNNQTIKKKFLILLMTVVTTVITAQSLAQVIFSVPYVVDLAQSLEVCQKRASLPELLTGLTIAEIKLSANNNDAQAQFVRGRMYETGLGSRQSELFAMLWYEKAAKQNHPDALFALGCLQLSRKGFQPALNSWVKAAMLGNAYGLITLNQVQRKLSFMTKKRCLWRLGEWEEYSRCLQAMYEEALSNTMYQMDVVYLESRIEEALEMATGVSLSGFASTIYAKVAKVESGERYSPIASNGFTSSIDEPLSTFSIDVDTASYAHIRRYLQQYFSQLPPKDSIRIEELINYFTYDYPQPEGDDPFSVTTEVSTAPWNPEHQLVHIGLQGRSVDMSEAPASNLVFLIDTSGSMRNDIVFVKKALKMLVNNLRDQDSISIVTYADSAGLALPATKGSDKQTILAAIGSMSAGGSTAGGAGIELAYKIAKQNYIFDGNNRVILASDGNFNVGVSSREGLIKLIESKRDERIFLSVLGFGRGNYADTIMESLADHGNGNYYYIDNLLEAKKVLVKEMGGTLYTIAKDVKIQVEFNPEKVAAYRLIGYENRLLNKEDFNDDKKDAGELGAGHKVTALYEIIPVGVAMPMGDVDDLKYQQTSSTITAKSSDEMMTVKLRYKVPTGETSKLITVPIKDAQVAFEEASDNFRFSSAVAAFGMLLRGSEYLGNMTAEEIQEIAKNAKGEDLEGYRAEFVRLIELAELLTSNK